MIIKLTRVNAFTSKKGNKCEFLVGLSQETGEPVQILNYHEDRLGHYHAGDLLELFITTDMRFNPIVDFKEYL